MCVADAHQDQHSSPCGSQLALAGSESALQS